MDERIIDIPSPKTKGTFFIVIQPALQGERCAKARICCDVERNVYRSFCEYIGFRFATSQIPCRA